MVEAPIVLGYLLVSEQNVLQRSSALLHLVTQPGTPRSHLVLRLTNLLQFCYYQFVSFHSTGLLIVQL